MTKDDLASRQEEMRARMLRNRRAGAARRAAALNRGRAEARGRPWTLVELDWEQKQMRTRIAADKKDRHEESTANRRRYYRWQILPKSHEK